MVASFTDDRNVVFTDEGVFNELCGTFGVLGAGYASGALTGGERSLAFATDGWGGTSLIMTPGGTLSGRR